MEIQATKNYYNAFNSFNKNYQSSEKTRVWSSPVAFFELMLFIFPQEIKFIEKKSLFITNARK